MSEKNLKQAVHDAQVAAMELMKDRMLREIDYFSARSHVSDMQRLALDSIIEQLEKLDPEAMLEEHEFPA